ncbi:MAG: ABC transporter permease subunit [Betaproteobacteria bacterium]|nr:ABC transporter permease subunit [Betaproteobacteria bacterium]
MAAASTTARTATLPSPAPMRSLVPLVLLALLVGVLASGVAEALSSWPDDWILPFRTWVTDFFVWFSALVKPLTRAVSWVLMLPLAGVEALLFRGVPDWELGPLPWVIVALGVVVFAHWQSGLRLALFCAACMGYLALFDLWSDSMQTLALVLVTVPLAAGLGLVLGVWATRRRAVERVLNTLFDVMQATPHMAYLGPVVVLFGFGQVPAMLATLIFALPPMARCTILGIRTVAPEIIEAGVMAGCTPGQRLWKVELPAAQQTLLLGLNQVVMQTLAMAVIASLVGASGLGQKLLFSLQQLRIGKAVEQGIAITLIALVLDRLTVAQMARAAALQMVQGAWWYRHRHMLVFVFAGLLLFGASRMLPWLALVPSDMTFSYGAPIDDGVRWISKNLYAYIKPFRNAVTIYLLLPIRDFYLWLPWSVVIGVPAALGWYLGGWRLSWIPVVLFGFLLVAGFWTPLMLTIYLVTSCAILCTVIGIPLGVWAAKNATAGRVILTLCDLLQTFPSFIYLIPVIMLFQTSDVSNVLAMLCYATVPAVRYTYLGLMRVPSTVVDAAIACGTTPRQRLFKVELPLAFPEILLGINQTIMMSLAMVAITALIGSRDLGQEIYKALPGADTGRGLLAGLGIAFIGIVADRLISAWAQKRKAALGLV